MIDTKLALETIATMHKICERGLFFTDSGMSYSRVLDGIALLADQIADYPDTSEAIWNLDGRGYAGVSDIISGAYWFCSDYNGGQDSEEYSCLCSVAKVYTPNMAHGVEPDSTEADVYQALETLLITSEAV